MHALHRFHLNRAVTAPVLAAVLAIIVSLVIAASLSNVGSTSVPMSASGTPAAASAVRAPEARRPLGKSVFSPVARPSLRKMMAFSATPFTSADFFTGQELRRVLARAPAAERGSQARNDG